MKNSIKRRWILGLVVATVTVASYAQWSNPADDVPAYHSSAPLKFAPLPPIMSGSQLTGENFRYPWQIHVYQQVAKVSSVALPAPLQLPLRPRPRPHQPAQLLRDAARHRVLHLRQGRLLTPTSRPSWARRRHEIRAAIARHEYEGIDLEKQ